MHSSRMRTVRCSSHLGGGVCLGDVCIPACTGQGVYVSQHALGRGCVCVSQHALGKGCVCVSQHALGRGCVYPSMHWAGCVCVYPGRHPPVNRMTDSCKNITFPQLLLRTVTTFVTMKLISINQNVCQAPSLYNIVIHNEQLFFLLACFGEKKIKGLHYVIGSFFVKKTLLNVTRIFSDKKLGISLKFSFENNKEIKECNPQILFCFSLKMMSHFFKFVGLHYPPL